MTRVTLEDVAKKTGVSSKTVSRVLNGEPNVSKRTAELVQAAIAELNYVPNSAARSLSSGRSLALGLVIGWPVNSPYSSTLIEGTLEACNRQGYNLSLYALEENLAKRITDAYRGRQVDGIILDTNAAADDALMSLIDTLKVPTVVLHPYRRHPHVRTSYIQIDNASAAREAVEYLIGLGHSCIGFVGHHLGHILDRYAGYIQALEAAGLSADPAWIASPDWPTLDKAGVAAFSGMPFHVGFQNATALLTTNKDMTALFAATDEIAMGALSAVWALGLKVPDDVSVVGFDDIVYASMVAPALTTVHQPINEIVSLAVKHLIDIIKRPETPPIDVVMPTNLVVRKSCKALAHAQPGVNGALSQITGSAEASHTP